MPPQTRFVKKLERRGTGPANILACREAKPLNKVLGPPHISILCNKRILSAIIDTGADRSLVSERLLRTVFNTNSLPAIEYSSVRLKGASGKALEVVGQTNLTFSILSSKFRHTFQVVNNLPDTILLGNDFLIDRFTIKHSRIIEFEDKGHIASVPLEYNIPRKRVRLVNDVIIPPLSSQILQLQVVEDEIDSPNEQDSDATAPLLITPADDSFTFIHECITVPKDSDAFCLIVNNTLGTLSLGPEDDIFSATPVITSTDRRHGYDEMIYEDGVYRISDLSPTGYRQTTSNRPTLDPIPTLREEDHAPRDKDNDESSEDIPHDEVQPPSEPPLPLLPTGSSSPGHHDRGPTSVVYPIQDSTPAAKDTDPNDGGKLTSIPPGYDPPSNSTEIDVTTAKAQGLSPDNRKRLVRILERYKGVFSTGPDDYGCTPLMTFKIDTGSNLPVAAKYRPVPLAYEKEVRANISAMQANGIIEDADSPWNSTLVLVRKPNGKLRICVNLKGVNSVTLNKTKYPINLQEESFAHLCNGKFYFRLDLSQAYYAIPLNESDKAKTAFSVFGRQYQFTVSPFGARYLPSQFNRLMTQIFHDMTGKLFYYFDDVIGAYSTQSEMLDGLATVLQRLLLANLRVNFAKSDFALTSLDQIKWLGSIIQGNKMYPDFDKIKPILELPYPHDRRSLQQFLGLVVYHKAFIPHYATLANPLFKYTSKTVDFQFGPEQRQAVDQLKAVLSSRPVLCLPNPHKPFIVTTDASDVGAGGFLSQVQDNGLEGTIAYCSRTFNPRERNASSCERELLAILWAIHVFHHYLLHNHFTLRSDARSLIFLRKFDNRNTKLVNYALTLAAYSFDIQHVRATRSNAMAAADALSRAHGPSNPDDARASYKALRDPVYEKIRVPDSFPREPVTKEFFRRFADQYLKEFEREHPTVTGSGVCLLSVLENSDERYTRSIFERIFALDEIDYLSRLKLPLELQQLAQEQKDDPDLAPIYANPEHYSTPSRPYSIIQGLLCVRVSLPSSIEKDVIVLPKVLIGRVLRHYHGSGHGPHIGRKRLTLTIRSFFEWKGMAQDIKQFCDACVKCALQAPNTNPQVNLGRHTTPQGPNQVINIDIVGPYPTASTGHKYVLTMQCNFSKFVLAKPLKNKTAEAIAKTVIDSWITVFGPPKFIRSDEGTDCDSALMQCVCNLLHIEKIRTPIYSPQANPVERWHATLNQAVRTWLSGQTDTRNWPTTIPFVAHAYNTSVHTVTKLTPLQVFTGHAPENPMVPIVPAQHPALDRYDYVKQLKRNQEIFWHIARQRLKKQQLAVNQPNEDKAVRSFQIGQYVLIRNFAPKHKLTDKWDGPYRIIEVHPNALHCVRWHLYPGRYRLKHHPTDHGVIEKRIVHPKDTKPWIHEEPSLPAADRKFAEQVIDLSGPPEDESSDTDESDDPGPAPTSAPQGHQQAQVAGQPPSVSRAGQATLRPLVIGQPTVPSATSSVPPTPMSQMPQSATSPVAPPSFQSSPPDSSSTVHPTPTPAPRPQSPSPVPGPSNRPAIQRQQPVTPGPSEDDPDVYASPLSSPTQPSEPTIDLDELISARLPFKIQAKIKQQDNMYQGLLDKYHRFGHPSGQPPPEPITIKQLLEDKINTLRSTRAPLIEATLANYLQSIELNSQFAKQHSNYVEYADQIPTGQSSSTEVRRPHSTSVEGEGARPKDKLRQRPSQEEEQVRQQPRRSKSTSSAPKPTSATSTSTRPASTHQTVATTIVLARPSTEPKSQKRRQQLQTLAAQPRGPNIVEQQQRNVKMYRDQLIYAKEVDPTGGPPQLMDLEQSVYNYTSKQLPIDVDTLAQQQMVDYGHLREYQQWLNEKIRSAPGTSTGASATSVPRIDRPRVRIEPLPQDVQTLAKRLSSSQSRRTRPTDEASQHPSTESTQAQPGDDPALLD